MLVSSQKLLNNFKSWGQIWTEYNLVSPPFFWMYFSITWPLPVGQHQDPHPHIYFSYWVSSPFCLIHPEQGDCDVWYTRTLEKLRPNTTKPPELTLLCCTVLNAAKNEKIIHDTFITLYNNFPASSIQRVQEALPPGVKRPGHEGDLSPPTSAEVKKTWIYISTPPYIFMMSCLIN
jgi:hypothetical protein